MKRLAALAILTLAPLAHGADKKAPPAKPATQYTLFETHEKEHVSIAADPCDKVDACPFFRNPYVRHGFLPVRVIITNDGDTSLDLNDVRIQFVSADRDIIPAALPEDLNRRLYNRKAAQGKSIPLPFPGARVPISAGAQVDKKNYRRRPRLRLPRNHRRSPRHPRRLPLLRHQRPRRSRHAPRHPLPQRDQVRRHSTQRHQGPTLRLQPPLRQVVSRPTQASPENARQTGPFQRLGREDSVK